MSICAQKGNSKPQSKSVADLELEIAELRYRLAQIEADNAVAATITDFCRRHRISRAYYYVLKSQNRGPREMRPGPNGTGPVLITREAEADWRREREAETVVDARSSKAPQAATRPRR
jgi:hypothetical protein